MKIHVCDIKVSEKVCFISGLRYNKNGNKYIPVPINISVKPIELQKVKTLKFPVVFDISFKKGYGAVINEAL